MLNGGKRFVLGQPEIHPMTISRRYSCFAGVCKPTCSAYHGSHQSNGLTVCFEDPSGSAFSFRDWSGQPLLQRNRKGSSDTSEKAG